MDQWLVSGLPTYLKMVYMLDSALFLRFGWMDFSEICHERADSHKAAVDSPGVGSTFFYQVSWGFFWFHLTLPETNNIAHENPHLSR